MKKGIITLLMIIFLTATALAAVNYSSQLSQVENNFFGIDYPEDTELVRLKRIEKVIYGYEQNGTIENRLKKIAQDTGTTFENKKAQTAQPPKGKEGMNAPLPTNLSTQPKKEDYVPEDSTVDYPIVDKIEQKVFNKTYKSENIYKRLDRLETKIFKSTSKDVLNTRVERLSDAVLYNEKTAQKNDSAYLPYPQQIQKNTQNYGRYGNNESGKYSDDNLSVQIATLERHNFNNVYINDSIGQRLNRLEQKSLGKTFPQDNAQTRVERLAAVDAAQSNSAMYDNNKTMRNVATFSQIGGILLMILAMIL